MKADDVGGWTGAPADLPVNLSEVVLEVTLAFEAYERALLAGDLDALDAAFRDGPETVRYGIADQQYGADEVAAWRRVAPAIPADRAVGPVVVTTFGRDAAVVACEFRNGAAAGRGRQSQTWIRGAHGWRIVHAHVSMLSGS
ncbi:MAG: hypothetical protein JWN46_1492 [Acidimicrobiales bacterium]|nr:hypothetical protein [Acidimicrobiales bacterium]